MSPQDWIAFGFQFFTVLATVIGIVWRAIKIPIDDKFKNQGERIGEIEALATTNSTKLEDATRRDLTHDFNISQMQRDIGRLETTLDRIDKHIRIANRSRQVDSTDIKERLVAIETRMDIFDKLNGTLDLAVRTIGAKRES